MIGYTSKVVVEVSSTMLTSFYLPEVKGLQLEQVETTAWCIALTVTMKIL
jgi:hypothetical protein